MRIEIVVESCNVDDVVIGWFEIKVEIVCGQDIDSEGREALANINVESFEDEVPNDLLKPQYMPDNNEVQDWVAVSALRLHRAKFHRHCEDGCETNLDEANTLFVEASSLISLKPSSFAADSFLSFVFLPL